MLTYTFRHKNKACLPTHSDLKTCLPTHWDIKQKMLTYTFGHKNKACLSTHLDIKTKHAYLNWDIKTKDAYLNLDLLNAFTTAASNPLLPIPTRLYFLAIFRTFPAKPYWHINPHCRNLSLWNIDIISTTAVLPKMEGHITCFNL